MAMSGGIDSTIASLLLHEEGYEVIGLTMKTWDYESSGGSKKETGCCSLDSINDARQLAVDYGFPHTILEINRQTTIMEENKTIREGVLADLTIRGMTHEIKFPFILTQSKNILTGEGSVDIDRTLYNIQYKSGKFFDDLGNHLIYDDFTVQFRVQTKIK